MAACERTVLILGLLMGLLLCVAFASVSHGIRYELPGDTFATQSGAVAPYAVTGCWSGSGRQVRMHAMVSKADIPESRDDGLMDMRATNFYRRQVRCRPVGIMLEEGENWGNGAGSLMSLFQRVVVVTAGAVTAENPRIVRVPAAPRIPTLPPYSGFDNVKVVQGTSGDQIELGTPGRDLIAQYGGARTVTQHISGDAGADWLLQVGAPLGSNQSVVAGTGNDTIHQYGNGGDASQSASGGSGDDTIVQVGGQGANEMTAGGEEGSDHIEQYGGPGSNKLRVDAGYGDDDILMVGGLLDDTFTYDLSAGNDIVRIYGNGGQDRLTINATAPSFTLFDGETGQALFASGTGGTTIIIFGVEHVHVLNQKGDVLYLRTVPPSPPPIPMLPPHFGFDYVKVVQGTSGDQIELGTEGRDLIAQSGGTATVMQYIAGFAGNDWLLQIGAGLGSNQSVVAGTGDDAIHQYGGGADTIQNVDGADGDDTTVQVGGQGANEMTASGGDGADHIEQYGGPGSNKLRVDAGPGDDNILMVGGPLDDTFTYDGSAGSDTVRIYGNGGSDSLTINAGAQSFTLYDGETGQVLFTAGNGGTTITIYGIAQLQALGFGGNIVHSRTAPPSPGAFSKSTPPHGAAGLQENPTLSWEAGSGATSYAVCIDTTNDSHCDSAWMEMGNSKAVILSGLLAGTTYSWQVRARNAAGTNDGNGGTWWSFTTAPVAPKAFSKISPANGATVSQPNPTLFWGGSVGATDYEYCIDTTDNSHCDGDWRYARKLPEVRLSSLKDGTTYYWQVRARNATEILEADTGTWWSFTIAPGSTSLIRNRGGGRSEVVDASTLAHKHLFGYQGWHACAGDGSKANRWIHWSKSGIPSAGNIHADLWPDMSELDADELFATELTYPDGSNAKVYSAFTPKTVIRHFQWMREAGIDGVMLQRFIASVQDTGVADMRNGVARNVKAGAEAHGRVFLVEYDISGASAANILDQLKNDWKFLVDTLELTDSPRYLRHKGKPAVAVWGFGFGNRPGTAEQAQAMIQWWKSNPDPKYQATVIGGVPTDWRSAGGAWAATYAMFDVISPWTVGRFGDEAGADSYRANYLAPDLAKAKSLGVEYLPVIFPGFSWSNWNSGSLNQIPRRGGKFYWRQAYNAVAAGAIMVKTAMFDEIDEGTAMYKLATDKSKVPSQANFVTLNIDGVTLPSDFYLRLGASATHMLRGEIPVSATQPITK